MSLTSFDRRHKARRWCWGYRRLKAQIQIPHGNWMCPISRDSTLESLHTTPNRLDDVFLSSHDRDETRGKNQGLRGRQLLWKVWNALATSDSSQRSLITRDLSLEINLNQILGHIWPYIPALCFILNYPPGCTVTITVTPGILTGISIDTTRSTLLPLSPWGNVDVA